MDGFRIKPIYTGSSLGYKNPQQNPTFKKKEKPLVSFQEMLTEELKKKNYK